MPRLLPSSVATLGLPSFARRFVPPSMKSGTKLTSVSASPPPSASFVSHAPTMTAPTAESGKPLYRRGLSFKDLWHVLKTRYPFSRLPWGATLGSSPGSDGGFPLPTSP
ncbi:hypothetical protein DB88DRAFT_474943 [Papiliotrema laurentii]|uniref:Uncharacterized protein n=1 Tax=Papiliotrema laurentii TaxID=5418 RepID=A0AAD9FMC6_PAPLA|nr:hypothetical protein DB88DRAFT_474943 [Papiliotrema laurentii]